MTDEFVEFLNPSSWKRPKGYSNVVSARGRMVFVAGQIGWNSEEVFETDDFAGQVRQVLENTGSLSPSTTGECMPPRVSHRLDSRLSSLKFSKPFDGKPLWSCSFMTIFL